MANSWAHDPVGAISMFFEMLLAELQVEILSAMEGKLVGDDQGSLCHYCRSVLWRKQGAEMES